VGGNRTLVTPTLGRNQFLITDLAARVSSGVGLTGPREVLAVVSTRRCCTWRRHWARSTKIVGVHIRGSVGGSEESLVFRRRLRLASSVKEESRALGLRVSGP